jgi:hypothetical protein
MRIYKTIILPVVSYGCETWYLTLREEHRLRVFENRVLKRIFGPKRNEVTGGWRSCIIRSFVICTLHQVSSIIIIIKVYATGFKQPTLTE